MVDHDQWWELIWSFFLVGKDIPFGFLLNLECGSLNDIVSITLFIHDHILLLEKAAIVFILKNIVKWKTENIMHESD